MQVELIGGVIATIDGDRADLGGAKSQAVVAILALNAGAAVPVSRLIELIWDDDPPRTAAKTLQSYVARLRRSCGPESIERVGDAYRMNVGPDDVDLVHFERLLERGEVRRALRLWNGVPLAGLGLARLEPVVTRLTERFLAATRTDIEKRISEGNGRGEIARLRGLVEEHPHREDLWGLLMHALYTADRQADALRAYSEARTLLVENVGVEPGPTLRSLHRQILEHDPGLRQSMRFRAGTSSSPVPPQLDFRNASRFVGRSTLLEALRTTSRRAVEDDRPSFVLVGGEPGVGKTRLAAEWAREANLDPQTTVLYGRCVEDHPSPFRPFTEALTAYVEQRSDRDLGPDLGFQPRRLAPVVPVLVTRFGDHAAVDEPHETPISTVHGAVIELLEHMSRSPVLIVLDDMQWADRSTIVLFRHIVREMRRGRLVVGALYRDSEVDRTHPLAKLLADLRSEQRIVRLPVSGVDAGESMELAEAVVGQELSGPCRDLAVRTSADARGNPFFLQEMLRHYMATGVLTKKDGAWTTSRDSASESSVPDGVREVVGERFRHVSEACFDLLRTASVFGSDFDIDVLGRVAALSEDEVVDLIDEAIGAHLVAEGGHSGSFEFDHALYRTTIYESLTTARIMLLHRRIGQALAETGRTDSVTVEIIAHHLVRGGPSSDADLVLPWARAGAERLGQRLAFQESADLLGRALETVGGSLTTDEQLELLAEFVAARVRVQTGAELITDVVELARTASYEAVARAAIVVSRAIGSVGLLGRSRDDLAGLFALVDVDRIDPRTCLMVEVEMLESRVGDPRIDDVMERIDEMDAVTLGRAVEAVMTRSILGEAPLRAFAERVSILAADLALPDASASVDELRRMIGEMTWEPVTSPVPGGARRPHGRADMAAVLGPAGDAIRTGDSERALAFARRRDGALDEVLVLWVERWLAYETDELHPGDPWPPAQDHLRRRLDGSAYSAVPHMYVDSPDRKFIRGLSSSLTDVNGVSLSVQLAHEHGCVDLAGALWARLVPARGLAAGSWAPSYVRAVDYHLGLVAAMQNRLDDALALQSAALDRSRSMGYALDEAYCALETVHLLGRRGAADDSALAGAVAAHALGSLAGTPYERRRRLLREALASAFS